MCAWLCWAEADKADTLREALAPGTVVAGAWALGLTLGLGLRGELIPDSRVSQTSELSPSPSWFRWNLRTPV